MAEPKQIFAPFTMEQVIGLNNYQNAGYMHPFTCGGDECREDLIATPDGWRCPKCAYTQNWAWEWMATPRFG